MVNSHEVARLAGVSQPTVSRALRDSPKVSAQTKQRVRAAAAQLGYVPSDVGRALSEGTTRRIGLVLNDLQNPFFRHLISPIHDELGRRGYQLLLITGDGDDVADRLAATSVDGVLLASVTTDSSLPARLADRGVPFTYLNRTTPGVEADSVTVDPAIGYQQLVDRLCRAGHRRIGAIFGPANTTTAHRRESMIRESLVAVGLDLVAETRGACEVTTGEQGLRELLDSAGSPTAVLCANDIVAFGALNAAVELGVSVPGEVSVVGFDDLPASGWPIVQLASIGFDVDRLARTGVSLMIDRLQHKAPEEVSTLQLPSHFVARRSLGNARLEVAEDRRSRVVRAAN